MGKGVRSSLVPAKKPSGRPGRYRIPPEPGLRQRGELSEVASDRLRLVTYGTRRRNGPRVQVVCDFGGQGAANREAVQRLVASAPCS